jgi:predicted cupin superfamily sugar epimerase
MSDEADSLVARLGLTPHPEGGFYRETFRDVSGPDGRSRSTAILFLLKAGQRSHWHRVDAVEIWHWYAGAPLALAIADGAGVAAVHRLGNGVVTGVSLSDGALEFPQLVVAEGHWQSAWTLGAYTLVGCTVAPGFEFSGFELAPAGWAPPGAVGTEFQGAPLANGGA